MSSRPDSTVAHLPAPRLAGPSVRPRVAWVNLVGLLALPLLACAVFLASQAQRYSVYIPLRAAQGSVLVRLFVDRGSGFEENPPLAVRVAASTTSQLLCFTFEDTRIVRLRLHPGGGPTEVAVGTVEVRADLDDLLGRDRVTARFGAGDLRPDPGASPGDPAFLLVPRQGPLAPGFDLPGFAQGMAMALAVYGLLVFLSWRVWNRMLHVEHFRRHALAARIGVENFYRGAAALAARHPAATLWLAAALGVMASCYPVIFCGKSFLSPNQGIPLLYARYPTLPGYTSSDTSNTHGSDASAMLWQSYPYSLVARRAMLHDGELPLWNRDNAGGIPLLGQGQSMLGDPLHWLVLLGGANSGVWDLKYLLARLLFAAGVGLLVRAATGHLPTAALLGFSASFLALFVYRYNHPACFSICASPWLLYAWVEIARARNWRALARWTALLLAADWCEMGSGTAKEAYMILLSVNACGLLVFALAPRPLRRWKLPALAALAGAGACFALASAPLWLTLMDALAHSWNNYALPRVQQLQPGLFVGLFDDIFYRQFTTEEMVLDPALNFLVLLGVVLAVGSARRLARHRTFVAAAVGAAAPLALAFGVVPPAVLAGIPVVCNVLHYDNTFSCAAFPPLFVVAGFGLARCWRGFATREWRGDVAAGAAVLGVLLGAYLGHTQAAQRSAITFLEVGKSVPLSEFFRVYAATLVAAALALPFLLRRLCLDRGASAPGIAPWVAICLGALLWRHGQQLPGIGSDRYVFHPQVRVDLQAASPVVDYLRDRQREGPSRVQGLGDNLTAGFNAAYGLESASGPDALQNPYFHALTAQPPLTMIWDWRLVSDRRGVSAQAKCYDALNVRYFLALPAPGPAAADDIPALRPAAHLDLDVYESPTAWPRAFFTDTLSICRGPADFFAQVGRGDGRPFAAMSPQELAAPANAPLAALAARRATDEPAARRVVPATDYRLTSATTTFRVHAPGPGVAVLLEAYAGADAQALVNGRAAPFFRVNQAFAGVYLAQAGDYEVVFRYRPRVWTTAFKMAGVGWALLTLTALALAITGRSGSRQSARGPAPVPGWGSLPTVEPRS